MPDNAIFGIDAFRRQSQLRDLERFRTWLGKIAARDYFAAPGGPAASDAIEQATAELAAFEEAALHAEAPGATPDP